MDQGIKGSRDQVGRLFEDSLRLSSSGELPSRRLVTLIDVELVRVLAPRIRGFEG